MNEAELKRIIEAVLFASDEPMDIKRLMALFPEDGHPGRDAIKDALTAIQADCEQRSIELKEVKSGYRFQVRQTYADWVTKLWEEKPARYSRAAMETIALIAYRQPITRAEIEEVRGVSVSTQIIKTLMERDWVKVVGHRDVPGKPALYATTRNFLDYFNLKSLEELPTLAEIRDIDSINAELDLKMPDASNDLVVEDSDIDTDTDDTGTSEVAESADEETVSEQEQTPATAEVNQ
ncbi:MAG: SMC-Scp complex subunit ScpB [Thioalkalispiraceae bacterium]|jgi:segregation and condensation protein B